MPAHEKGGWTYILGSDSLRLYVGVTSNLFLRMQQHKTRSIEGFTSRYKINRLLWFKQFGEIELAILREKQKKMATGEKAGSDRNHKPGLSRSWC